MKQLIGGAIHNFLYFSTISHYFYKETWESSFSNPKGVQVAPYNYPYLK